MRRFGDTPKPGEQYFKRPGVYAILPRGGNLLLSLQGKRNPALHLPGGGIDPGESPLQALYREVLEETGWLIAKPRRMGAYREYVYMPEYDIWADKSCTVYYAEPVRQLGPATEAYHEAVFMDADTASNSIESSGERYFVGSLL
ncbi:MAG: NUDIX hydrolase [Pseudomonadota bacterium]